MGADARVHRRERAVVIDRFCQKPPHHPTSRILLDSSVGGSLQTKTTEEALALIELVANNQYVNFSE
ncbi:hypothetical protein PIB30_099676 [Stylosanthes scabra]|uniref:Uncharacterized protein n=1 Tax=Stylosanthes scabra TaxID=79078 RepID=A0ABU6SXN4_9FABA|nr:hypothetical protein [Stylosanthes scabra]